MSLPFKPRLYHCLKEDCYLLTANIASYMNNYHTQCSSYCFGLKSLIPFLCGTYFWKSALIHVNFSVFVLLLYSFMFFHRKLKAFLSFIIMRSQLVTFLPGIQALSQYLQTVDNGSGIVPWWAERISCETANSHHGAQRLHTVSVLDVKFLAQNHTYTTTVMLCWGKWCSLEKQ